MKKYIFISAVALFAFSSFLVSCSEEEEETKMCTCVEYDYYYGDTYTKQLNPASFGAKYCSDLAIKLRMANDDEDYSYDCY